MQVTHSDVANFLRSAKALPNADRPAPHDFQVVQGHIGQLPVKVSFTPNTGCATAADVYEVAARTFDAHGGTPVGNKTGYYAIDSSRGVGTFALFQAKDCWS